MRVFLMLLGTAISAAALLFWIWLNRMAAAYALAESYPPVEWLTEEALYFFWLPFGVGAAIAYVGWKRS